MWPFARRWADDNPSRVRHSTATASCGPEVPAFYAHPCYKFAQILFFCTFQAGDDRRALSLQPWLPEITVFSAVLFCMHGCVCVCFFTSQVGGTKAVVAERSLRPNVSPRGLCALHLCCLHACFCLLFSQVRDTLVERYKQAARTGLLSEVLQQGAAVFGALLIKCPLPVRFSFLLCIACAVINAPFFALCCGVISLPLLMMMLYVPPFLYARYVYKLSTRHANTTCRRPVSIAVETPVGTARNILFVVFCVFCRQKSCKTRLRRCVEASADAPLCVRRL